MGRYRVVLIRREDMVLDLIGHSHGECIDTPGDRNVLDILPVFRGGFEKFLVPALNAYLEMNIPLYRWFEEEFVKLDIGRIVEQRCSDMDNIIEVVAFERVIPGTRFRIIRDNRE